jgi:uncharacterized protein (TIGR02757 family)
MDILQLKQYLDKKVAFYNHEEYICTDPIQIPHRYFKKQDIEISAFLTATISWGQRKTIIKNAALLMELLENTPFEFVMQASENEIQNVRQFVHRTFNGLDCEFFIRSLRDIYHNNGGLETIFTDGYKMHNSVYSAINHFRNQFLRLNHAKRTEKHISNVAENSAAKRLNMFLRWMIRNDQNRVDFGIWKGIPTSALMMPLDVHSGNVSRALGLLQRKQNDWKAVEELMTILRKMDVNDPVKYDYALFGIGVFENKKNIDL